MKYALILTIALLSCKKNKSDSELNFTQSNFNFATIDNFCTKGSPIAALKKQFDNNTYQKNTLKDLYLKEVENVVIRIYLEQYFLSLDKFAQQKIDRAKLIEATEQDLTFFSSWIKSATFDATQLNLRSHLESFKACGSHEKIKDPCIKNEHIKDAINQFMENWNEKKLLSLQSLSNLEAGQGSSFAVQ